MPTIAETHLAAIRTALQEMTLAARSDIRAEESSLPPRQARVVVAATAIDPVPIQMQLADAMTEENAELQRHDFFMPALNEGKITTDSDIIIIKAALLEKLAAVRQQDLLTMRKIITERMMELRKGDAVLFKNLLKKRVDEGVQQYTRDREYERALESTQSTDDSSNCNSNSNGSGGDASVDSNSSHKRRCSDSTS
jgi:hypothetical protein